MLIAQAQVESALLVTRDTALRAYGTFVTLG
jgi:PIN domain nuclease of toxin-antitoxin system